MNRRWDENIGKLMVFIITITISLWVLATFSFFYVKNLNNKKYMSILANTNSNLKDLNTIWLCKTSIDSNISYEPIFDRYTLKCSGKLWKNIWKLISIQIFSGCLGNDIICIYKIRK